MRLLRPLPRLQTCSRPRRVLLLVSKYCWAFCVRFGEFNDFQDAIKSVQLKKPNETNRPPAHQNSTPNRMGNGPTQSSNSNVDFQADLRNALAKRRSKVAHDEDEEDRGDMPHARFNGLSLRETVRENVEGKTKQHSPPGIAHKKDSGYTSSRTSLEPEIEDKHDHVIHFIEEKTLGK